MFEYKDLNNKNGLPKKSPSFGPTMTHFLKIPYYQTDRNGHMNLSLVYLVLKLQVSYLYKWFKI